MTKHTRKLLKIQTSLFQNDGQSTQLANQFADQWLTANPGGEIVSRNLAASPVPHLDLERFQALNSDPAERTPEQQDVVDFSNTLIEEIREADTLVFGIPMYNFSVPSSLHAYFDHIARAGVTFQYTENGPQGLLTGKRAYVVITRGGLYGEDHAQTNFIRQFLGFIGINEVEFIYAEGLAMGDESRNGALSAARERLSQLA
ncbi:NAD(P)H-dependent oxidoreductase [Microbulbifer sp. CAU 1566]|uniref:FMN-dependent NADH-azoreductase n=1 Tax=Microbulbifer sp. CAU 1566 TaxID=2933269 RepID=UPI0020049CA5|nr:NAD(P)H-dependent oxidoreductase [Microbulbifer sp. CAU 1566]MCK7596826.1 NAD(P)H-dependent oxidoreductase [Microbulbifer sp. CAU 1566]